MGELDPSAMVELDPDGYGGACGPDRWPPLAGCSWARAAPAAGRHSQARADRTRAVPAAGR